MALALVTGYVGGHIADEVALVDPRDRGKTAIAFVGCRSTERRSRSVRCAERRCDIYTSGRSHAESL